LTTSALLTDLYELTMLAGYLEEGISRQQAVFELFYRVNPFEGGYAVCAGLEPALQYLEQVRFQQEELDYLAQLGIFAPRFLEYLRSFRFRGSVTAPPEGTVVFPGEPLLTVEGDLSEAQFVETALLNIINYQTLVATKAARISHAAGNAPVIEFGLRRAQGPDGGLSCARAACVGGICSTSNVLAGMQFGLPVRGTHAHSWIQAFPDELSAFRSYAHCFPRNLILLVDTYDTLRSGIPNAIIVARELRERGHELLGVRLDSGDLAQLSRQARAMLDAAGFPQVKILASNDLDEYGIEALRRDGARIDLYGVGTRLATCSGAGGGALGGVYKLVELDGRPSLKITCDPLKATLPGKKRILRVTGPDGVMRHDMICRAEEPATLLQQNGLAADSSVTELQQVVMRNGSRTGPPESLAAAAERCKQQLAALPPDCLKLTAPRQYPVEISPQVYALKDRTIAALTR